MAVLDKTSEFSQIFGGTGETRFIQDGCRYSAAGKYLGKVGGEDRKPFVAKPVIIEHVVNDGTVTKKDLIELATSHGIRADGRMSEETIRSKLKSNNVDIP